MLKLALDCSRYRGSNTIPVNYNSKHGDVNAAAGFLVMTNKTDTAAVAADHENGDIEKWQKIKRRMFRYVLSDKFKYWNVTLLL